MEALSDFIKTHQESLSPSKNIVISVGVFSENNIILNCHLNEEVVKSLLEILKGKKIRYETKNCKIYREGDMEYIVDSEGETNITKKYYTLKNYNIDSIGFRSKLIEYETRNIEDFPSNLNYCDEFTRSTIIIHYNSLFDILIITEQRDKPVLKLEIHITRQNIYADKLIKNVEEVVKIIVDKLKES